MRQLQTHYFAHFLLWQLLGMALRPPRFLCHPGQTFAPKTLPPLVSRLGADSVLLTHARKLSVCIALNANSIRSSIGSLFFHGMPRFYLTTPPKSVTYVLNLLCYLCSEPAPPSPSLHSSTARRQ